MTGDHARRRIQGELDALTQAEQAGDVIDVATGHHHGLDRAGTRSILAAFNGLGFTYTTRGPAWTGSLQLLRGTTHQRYPLE